MAAMCAFPAEPPIPSPSEYQLKAAVMYNFANFVVWPARCFPSAKSPFIIATVGEDPFKGVLEQTVRGKETDGHPFEIRHFKSLAEVRGCHMLFISSTERRKVAEIIEALGEAPVLTVGEMDRFLQTEGMINFLMEGNKVRFEINAEAARKAGLKVSSKLLYLARVKGKAGTESK